VDSMTGGFISNHTIAITGEMHEQLLAKYPDFLAFFICMGYCLALGFGVKTGAVLNGALTLINLIVLVIVVCLGMYYADFSNWEKSGGFLPFGFGGVLAGAASCFYAFVGFDSIAVAGEEARNPTKSIPIATGVSLLIVTIIYILVSATLTLMVPIDKINPSAALPEAFGTLNIEWAKYVISTGALLGMTSTLLGSLYALPRCLYAMASDGLLFSFFGRVNTTTQIPLFNLALSGFLSALLALLFDLEKLVEFMSIGTLLAYTIGENLIISFPSK
jgi:cationic amino acid transporter 4